MAAVTHVTTLACVAQLLGEDLELLEAIVENDDNLTYGSIVSVQTGRDDYVTALTGDGIHELKGMLADARSSTENWIGFLDDFVSDPDVNARVKAKSPR
ncbi:MAG: hypothetical protein K5905_12130 [Roseibium sp.]|uniref:hypothetical protein n=1 Tax=Roseibium sp. TaxID=1936156 RepID=UPI002622EADA|nr:hypothetical protein [Roseibium sp.]MCV0426215.1 hypothetical protein [Roseibium sp.]